MKWADAADLEGMKRGAVVLVVLAVSLVWLLGLLGMLPALTLAMATTNLTAARIRRRERSRGAGTTDRLHRSR